MIELPSVTVIIPAHNRAEFLEEALDSIARQQYPAAEILVVDDGSTDEWTRQIVRNYSSPVEYVRQEHRGPAAARNTGIRHARSELIAFLDNDDLYAPGSLNVLAECFVADPDTGIAHGRMRNFRDAGQGARCWCSPPYHLPSLPSAMYRRSLFDKVGMLDETLQFGEDSDFFIRCWELNVPKVKLDRVGLLYRRHGGNMTANRTLRELGLVGVYRKRRDRIQEGRYTPVAMPFGSMRDYLGESPAAYDDGNFEPVEEEFFPSEAARAQA
jgi:glycosyltransferase involved in cell wall biosynthesis